jgi:two-component system response regulator AtoC
MFRTLIISEAPEEHHPLSRRLEAAGAEVFEHSGLRAALPMIRSGPRSPLTVIVELKAWTEDDVESLIELNNLYPAVQTLLFATGEWHRKALGRLQELGNLRIFARSLSDPTSHGLISEYAFPGKSQAGPMRIDSAGVLDAHVPATGLASPIPPTLSTATHSEEFLRRVGLSDVPVVLQGETGVGKEVMARRLWAYSSRSGKPFFKLNCTALPSELIESELFGYDKGAFTGATADKPGKFELAQNGTILLDEIGDMDIRLQAKLLQVLQDGEVQPLGSARLIKVNVRVMAATHRDLQAAIAKGAFREDLYYRLSVINITVPPLRERRDEILPLAEKLLLRYTTPGTAPVEIPEALKQAMLAHPWPGNVRELENLMRRLIVYQDADLLAAELRGSLVTARLRRATDTVAEVPRISTSLGRLQEASRSAESKLLLETLESARWNRRQAALRLNLDYKALLYKLQKYGIVEGKGKRRELGA